LFQQAHLRGAALTCTKEALIAGDLERRCPECSPEVVALLHTLAAYVDIEFELVDEISDWIIFERKTN